MRLFLNSCVLEEIEEIAAWGILGGLTMNPTMLSQVKTDYVGHLKTICSMVDDIPVLAQVVSTTPQAILEEGKALASINPKIVVKVHTNPAGIQGMRLLKAAGVKVCATAIHSVVEAIVAAEAGVDHVAVFVGLLGELDENPPNQLLVAMRRAFDNSDSAARLLCAGRSVNQIVEAAVAGADEATCAYKIWKHFLSNAYTQARWDAFIGDWTSVYGDRNWITGY
jgi:transaldolase